MPPGSIETNLTAVRAGLSASLARAGRPPDSCRLLAVSKNRTPAEIDALAACGVGDFGENRVQEAERKMPEVKSGVRWHMIGHLQRNKARKAVELFEVIHSIDSIRLLDTLGAEAEKAGKTLEVFFEVNVSGEEQKHGFRPDEVASACERVKEWPHLRAVGLMTMAPFVDDPETVRPVFRGLRELRDRLNESGVTAEPLTELSMGMTQDYEVAAEEGATWVRVGTALFEDAR